MTAFLAGVHQWLGYLVVLAVLVVAAVAFGRAKDAREFTPGPYVVSMVLVDVQALLGIIIYLVSAAWEAQLGIAVLHPVLGLLALAVGHIAVRRARSEQMVVAAHRKAGRGLVVVFVLLVANVVVATVPDLIG